MPLYNWIKLNEGKIEFIYKKPVKKVSEEAYLRFMKLNDEYIKEFGLSKLYARMLKTQKERLILQLDFVITRNKFKLTQIKLKEQQLKNMIANKGEGVSINESLIQLSKWIGYRLNPKEITTLEYFNILKHYGKANKEK